MPRSALRDQLKTYRLRIDMSRRWRKDYEAVWKRMIDMYRGKHFNVASKNDQVAVNIAKATVDIISTSVSVNDPKITITARKEEDHPRAIISEAIMDYWFTAEHLQFTPEIQLAVRDSLILGHGWVKTGWKFSENERDMTPDEVDALFAEQAQQVDSYAQDNPALAGSLPTDDEIFTSLPTTVPEVDVDQPFAERVSPFDIFVDPEATSPRNMRWIAQKIEMPIREAQQNELWDAQARNKLSGEIGFPDEWVKEEDKEKKHTDIQRVTIWEFYDLVERTLCVFSEGGERFLVKPQEFPYAFGQPFEQLRDYEVPDQFYPMGELEAIEPLQLELNKTRSQLMQARAQYIRKTFYREEALGKGGREALESDEENWVPVATGQWTLADVAAPAPVAPIPSDLFDYSGEIIQNVDLVTATSEYDRGGAAQDIRRTATEAALIQDKSNSRSADRLSRVEKFIGAIGANLHCLARQFLSTEQVAHVAGVNATPLWVPYEADTFDFDADFQVVGGSTQPVNEAYRLNQVSLMLQNLGPLIGQVIDPVAVARWALESYGVRNPDKFIIQPTGLGVDPTTGQPTPPEQGTGAEGELTPPPAPGPQGAPPTDPSAAGIPPEILAQLAGQVGIPA